MKTIKNTQRTANPRRTTLSDLENADELTVGRGESTPAEELPIQTANPQRTVLATSPDA